MNENRSVDYSDSDEITRKYLDSLLVSPRYIDSDIPSVNLKMFDETFETPICTAALSHLDGRVENGMAIYAAGAKKSGAIHFMGMGEDKELERVTATGARTIRIIKPLADEAEIFRKMDHAITNGVFALGMDIDHSFNSNGGYDNVNGFLMHPKSFSQLKKYVEYSKVPFVIKGVLSVDDAKKCVDLGAKGIVISHHHNMLRYSVPPLMILPQIKKVIGDKIKIFVDCGIVSSMDVYKALALGADAVCVGRELMNYLDQGADGVSKRIDTMTMELKSIMARTGMHNLDEMNDSVIFNRTTF